MSSRVLVVLVLVLSMVLVSCAPAATPAPTPAPAAPTPAPATPTPPPAEECPEGVITIDALYYYPSDQGLGVPYHQAVEDFEATHPCIKVETSLHGMDYHEYVSNRYMAGDPPDTFCDHISILVQRLAREGALMPLDKYLDEWTTYEGDKPWRDAYAKSVLDLAWCDVEGCAENPGTYCVPWDSLQTGFYYRKDVFEQYGLEEPKTWQELMDTCQEMLDQGVYCFTSDIDWFQATNYWFDHLAARIVGGQKLFDTATNKPGTSWVDEPGFLTAAQELYRAADYFVPGWTGFKWPLAQNDWSSGGCLMLLISSWLPSEIKEVAPDLDMGWFPFPCYEGSTADCSELESTFNCWVISAESEHPDAVAEWLQFVTAKKYQDQFVQFDTSPGRLDAAVGETDYVVRPLEAANEAGKLFTLGFDIDMEEGAYKENVYAPLVQKLMSKELTPEDFIQELERQTDDWYATH